MTSQAKNISVNINLGMEKVYSFISNPENLPLWAQGLSQSKIRQDGEFWVTDSPMGIVKVRFTEKNKYGVVDHDVILPSGEINHNPLRVIKNGEGSTVIFTLFHLPRMSNDEFQRDAKFIEGDLEKLKSHLESL